MATLQVNEQNLGALAFFLQKSLDANEADRRKAEEELGKFKGQHGFATLMLHLMRKEDVDLSIRKAASILFKNYVVSWWESNMIPEAEKAEIKKIYPSFMLALPAKLQPLASAILYEIAKLDFPKNWESLLPDLISKLQTNDFNVIVGVLKILNAVTKKYRWAMVDQETEKEVVFILQHLQEAHLALLTKLAENIKANSGNEQALKPLFTACKLLMDIMYSICKVDLPAYVEDHLKDYMSVLHYLLAFETKFASLLEHEDDDDAPGLFHKVQARIFVITRLFIERFEEEFQPYLQGFMGDAWALLMKTPNKAKFDALVAAAMAFLATVAGGVFSNLFADPQNMASICEKIIVPNLKLRENDVYQFEDDAPAYVLTMIEGQDNESRRGSAFELIKALRKHFEKEVTEIFAKYISHLLEEYHKDKKQWKTKEAAICLITALAIQTKSRDGVTSMNPLVPIGDFFAREVVTELQADVDASPFVQSASLNFVVNFRRHFDAGVFNNVFPLCVKFLASKHEAVRSFAGLAVDQLLDVRDVDAQQPVKYTLRFGRQHLKGVLEPTLTAIATALSKHAEENAYVIRALSRVISVAETDTVGLVAKLVQLIGSRIAASYKQPKNPLFGHYLWDALAACVKVTVQAHGDNRASVLDEYEKQLFPLFEKILTEADADAYAPFVFQVMAMLIELRAGANATIAQRRGTLKPIYKNVFKRLTEPVMWESPGNIPALTRLLQAYVEHDPELVLSGDLLGRVLGVFQRLISSKANDFLGFYLLQSLTMALPLQALEPHIPQILRLIFMRLQGSKTMQLMKSFCIFLAYFTGRHSATVTIQAVNSVQPEYDSIWEPTVTLVRGAAERKACAVAGIQLLTSPQLRQPPYVNLWPSIMKSVVMLLEGATSEASAAAVTGTVLAVDEHAVTSTSFSELKNASKAPSDYFAEIPEARAYVIQHLHNESKKSPGVFPHLLAQTEQAVQAALQSYAQACHLPQQFVV